MFESIVFIFMMGAVLFYPPAALAINCYKSCMRHRKLTFSEMLLCAIPLWNLHVIRKSFFGSAKVVDSGLSFILVCSIVRALALTVFLSNEWLVLISSVGMMISLALIWLLTAYVTFDTACCVSASTLVKVLCWIAPPLGAFIVSKEILPYMKSVKEELDGTFGDTNK